MIFRIELNAAAASGVIDEPIVRRRKVVRGWGGGFSNGEPVLQERFSLLAIPVVNLLDVELSFVRIQEGHALAEKSFENSRYERIKSFFRSSFLKIKLL